MCVWVDGCAYVCQCACSYVCVWGGSMGVLVLRNEESVRVCAVHLLACVCVCQRIRVCPINLSSRTCLRCEAHMGLKMLAMFVRGVNVQGGHTFVFVPSTGTQEHVSGVRETSFQLLPDVFITILKVKGQEVLQVQCSFIKYSCYVRSRK